MVDAADTRGRVRRIHENQKNKLEKPSITEGTKKHAQWASSSISAASRD